MNYYNEFDRKTAAWLRELINQGYLPKGDVDERSIVDVRGGDLAGYTQCHFFAGIGGWPYALQLAGWPTTEPVWTGSCPCQPFSCAGKGRGTEDERHLWPEFARLIGECSPTTVFGEQVASRAGREWLSGVLTDLEGMGYAAAGADLCAACKAAPHPRQRLFWVANTDSKFNFGENRSGFGGASSIPSIWQGSEVIQEGQRRIDELVARRITSRVSSYADARSDIDGIPAYMEQMRGAGNAIVPQVAAEFIRAFIDASECMYA